MKYSLVFISFLLISCGSQDTALTLTIYSPVNLSVEFDSIPTQLAIKIITNKDPNGQRTILTPTDGSIFPSTGKQEVSINIIAAGRSGAAQLYVEVLDATSKVLAFGETSVILSDGSTAKSNLTLSLADFQLNTTQNNSQTFAQQGGLSRQLATSGTGKIKAIWMVDDCSASEQLPCSIYHRDLYPPSIPSETKFEEKDLPLIESTFENLNSPAIAMADETTYIVAFDAAMSGSDIFLLPVVSNNHGTPVKVNTDPAFGPDITKLANGNYAGCWFEWQTNASYLLKCGIFDKYGSFRPGIDQNAAAFTVENIIGDGFDLIDGPVKRSPFVAISGSLIDGSFMALWSQQCGNGCYNLKAKIFNASSGTLSAAFDIANTQTNQTQLADIISLPSGYMVAWSDINGAQGTDIFVRRFSTSGSPLENAYVLNTTLTGNQYSPTLAYAQTRGEILVAWTSDDQNPDDPQGGIRGRMLLANGIPLGSDISFNTTRAGLQNEPALIENTEGFVLGFKDNSKTGSDQSGTSLRAQYLYPNYDPHHLKIGSHCDASSQNCENGLYCQTITLPGINQNQARCINRCVSNNPLCLNGGTCQQIAGKDIFACQY